MGEEFTDIRMIRIDGQATLRKDRWSSPMLDVHIELTSPAPHEWARIFNAKWALHGYNLKRRAAVVGRHIVMRCPVEEFETIHKRELEVAVALTNREYRELLDSLECDAAVDNATSA